MSPIVHLVRTEVLKRKEKQHMNKIVKIICGLYFIIFFVNAQAGPKVLLNYPWNILQMPTFCGPIDEVNDLLKRGNYVEVAIAFGRIGGSPKGDIVYAEITYASREIQGHIIRTIETPGQSEKCVLAVLYDYIDVSKK